MRFLTAIALTAGLVSVGYIVARQIQETQPTFASGDPVIAAAGDIACDPRSSHYKQGKGTEDNCRMKATSDLLVNANLAAVLPLGDNQYERGSFENFQQSYDPTWGRVKSITRPVVGNHEYLTNGAYGYFKYFGAAIAGDWKKGYYSYDIGSWHLIALNSNCQAVGGCQAGSTQEKWLKADLAAHPNACTLAYWHHPRFSSGKHHGNDGTYDAFWKTLYASGVEIVLNGHEHNYERFAPQSPDAKLDPKQGIRQFVVGTGGKSLYPFGKSQANSEVRNADTYGVLMLTLHPNGYSWKFVPEAGKNFTDSGSDVCH
jgi:hypothetical protein